MEKHGGAGKRVKNRIAGKPDYGRTDRETAEVIEQKFACGAKNARRLSTYREQFFVRGTGSNLLSGMWD